MLSEMFLGVAQKGAEHLRVPRDHRAHRVGPTFCNLDTWFFGEKSSSGLERLNYFGTKLFLDLLRVVRSMMATIC